MTPSELDTNAEGATSEQATESFWKGKRILLVSPEPWGKQKVSKHHYANALQELGADVYFLDPPAAGTYGIKPREADAPFVVHSPPLVRGLRFLPAFVRAYLEKQHLRRLAEACGGPFDVLWNFDLYRFGSLRDRSYARTRLLHVMDLPAPNAVQRPASNADAVVLVSKSMELHLPIKAPQALHVPHGVALAQVANTPLPSLAQGKRLGYVGNMALRYLDLAAFLKIAEDHPDCTIYFIGPLGGQLGGDNPSQPEIWNALLSLPNVVWVGAVPSSSIPSWLKAMDLLLISYDSARFPQETAHPHKVLEYLQSGKPILSSHLRDYAHLGHLMTMMAPGISISDGIDQALSALDTPNRSQEQEQRQAIARSSSYAKHVSTITQHLLSKRTLP